MLNKCCTVKDFWLEKRRTSHASVLSHPLSVPSLNNILVCNLLRVYQSKTQLTYLFRTMWVWFHQV